MPPLVDACKQDSDCDATYRGDNCCLGCAVRVGTKPWVASVEEWCTAHPPDGCPKHKCALEPKTVKCDAGRCVHKPK